MAYFYMVRIYGAVPVIHNNSEMIRTDTYNSVYRAKIDNVYDYIVKTLEQAIKWLPEKNREGRIDRYSAYGLLAKVYLTKSGYGRSGDRNQDDLDKAREYAAKVVNESGRSLMPNYEDIFRGSNNKSEESLIAWRWTAAVNNWTSANPHQSDMASAGFDEYNCWGGWRGPSLDLQEAFDENALNLTTRNNTDKRRKATMMMYGDVYGYFWRDHPLKDKNGTDGAEKVSFPNGFDFTLFFRDVKGGFESPTGANCVKHLIGNKADHIAETGEEMPGQMCTGLATHILRLADIYLVYAEAILGNGASTADPEALSAFNAVRKRAGVAEKSVITFEDIFRERRLELAFEGDFWYDFVRLSYYKPDEALAKLNAQNRKIWDGIGNYYMDGEQDKQYVDTDDPTIIKPRINEDIATGQPYASTVFTMPFPEVDLQMNPRLLEAPQDIDINQFKY
jgi:hypothetical protein